CDFLKYSFRQCDLSKNGSDLTAGDSLEILFERHNEYSTQINRSRAHCQLSSIKDLGPMFFPRKQAGDPLLPFVKKRNVDQRFWPLAGRICQQLNSEIHVIHQDRPISAPENEHIPRIVRHDHAVGSLDVSFDRKEFPRTGLKVHVIWSRGPTFRAVVDDEVPRQVCCDIEHIPDLMRDVLHAVFLIDDSEVVFHDGERIAINREARAEFQSLLLRIQIGRTQKTWAFRDRLLIDGRRGARHTVRDVTDEYVEPIDAHAPGLRLGEAPNAFSKPRP